MAKVHRLLRPSSCGQTLDVVFDHPLGKALHELPKVLSTQDAETPDKDFSLKKVKGKGDFGTAFKPKVAALLKAAAPSPFGKGEQTVFDESVRRGKELTAETLSVPENDPFIASVKRTIKKDLFPKARDVTLRFYKLAIYEAGGHFDFHRDTTHAANHHATLLVEVKSEHEGGQLIFESGGAELEGIDFSTSDEEELAWIAFYTDVRHKVQPVTQGTRIVLQYDVLVEKDTAEAKGKESEEKDQEEEDDDEKDDEEDEEDDEEDDEDDEENEDGDREEYDSRDPYLTHNKSVDYAALTEASNLDGVLSALEEAFAKMKAKASSQAKNKNNREDAAQDLALPLFHLYRTESILPDYLKGVDRQLFFALLKTGLYDLALSPIVLNTESDYEGDFNHRGDATYFARLTDPVDKIYTGLSQDGHAEEVSVGSDHPFNTRKAEYIVTKREPEYQLEHTSYVEYTGNEAQCATYKYFLGAMLVSKKEQKKEPKQKIPAKKRARRG